MWTIIRSLLLHGSPEQIDSLLTLIAAVKVGFSGILRKIPYDRAQWGKLDIV